MTAALHLARTHQPPPGPNRKWKGGGGGDGYDALVARVYRDSRMTRPARAHRRAWNCPVTRLPCRLVRRCGEKK